MYFAFGNSELCNSFLRIFPLENSFKSFVNAQHLYKLLFEFDAVLVLLKVI